MRVRMVTRTITVTTVKVLCMDMVEVQPVYKELELTGASFDNESALKQCKKEYDSDTLKVVSVASMTTKEEIYGMKEIDFLKVASKLDASRKVVGDEVEIDD